MWSEREDRRARAANGKRQAGVGRTAKSTRGKEHARCTSTGRAVLLTIARRALPIFRGKKLAGRSGRRLLHVLKIPKYCTVMLNSSAGVMWVRHGRFAGSMPLPGKSTSPPTLRYRAVHRAPASSCYANTQVFLERGSRIKG